jgi:hypothetical protein
MRHLIGSRVWLALAAVLCAHSAATAQPPGGGSAPPAGPSIPLGKLVGKWKSTRDGSVITVTPSGGNEVRLEGRHVWKGTYSGQSLQLIRYPSSSEMSDRAPEWARKRVEHPPVGIGSPPTDSSRYLKWVLTLRYEEACDEIALTGEWDPGEVVWREERSPGTGNVKQEASVSPRGPVMPVKYVREFSAEPNSTRTFRIWRLVVSDPAWDKKIAEVQEAIKKQDVELNRVRQRFDVADREYGRAADGSRAAVARRESVRASLRAKIHEADRVLLTDEGIRLRDELIRTSRELGADIDRMQAADPDYKTSQRYLDTVRKLEETQERLSKLLAEARRLSAGGDRGVRLRQREAEVRALDIQFSAAQKQAAAADALLAQRFSELNSAFYELERNRVQWAELLKQFDDLLRGFFLRSVIVDTRASARVFEAKREDPPDLAGIQRRLELAQDAMMKAKPAKEEAFRAFMKETREATTALAGLEARIMVNAVGQATVEMGFTLYELGQAGAKGGLGGFVVEGLRKIGESVTMQLIEGNVGDLSGVDERSIEAAMNLVYEQDILRNPTSIPQLEKLALTRGAKELVTRRLRNAGNQTLGVTIEAMRDRSLERLAKDANRLQKLGTNMENLLAKQDLKFRDLGKGLLRDGLKTAFRKLFQDIEASAWENYFFHDIRARALFPVYQIANKTYLDAFDEYNRLLEEKNKLLGKIDPSAGMKVRTREFFPEYTPLVITVDPARPEYGESVALNDRLARPLGNHRHCILTPDYNTSVVEMTLRVVRQN